MEWAIAPFSIDFHLDNPLVIAARNARGHTPVAAAPVAAKSVTVDLVRAMEGLTFNAPPAIVAWSGVFLQRWLMGVCGGPTFSVLQICR